MFAILILILSIALFAVIASQLTFKLGLTTNVILFIVLIFADGRLSGWTSGFHWLYLLLSLIALVICEIVLADLPKTD